jgi:glycosyltransferase involved in cell wall biosynthesis
MKRIYLVNKNFPIYRKSIWDRLLDNDNNEFTFCFSNESFKDVRSHEVSRYNYKNRFHKIKNLKFFNWIYWQTGVLSILLKKVDTVIFLGEMSILSTWITTILLRFKNVKVIFWGHGMYGKDRGLKRYLRISFLKLANHNLVYEKFAKELMIKNGFKESEVSIVYNSINYFEQLSLFKELLKSEDQKIFQNEAPTLLFIGRLTKVKKIDQLIRAAIILNKRSKYNLLIIGDGEMRDELKTQAKELIVSENCIFYGECYDEKELSKLIYNADLTVSPGNVGLTAIHSLSFGTPVCSHSNYDNQMPEVESIINGINGFLFLENDIESMVNGISKWFERTKPIDKAIIRDIIDKKYNPEYQEEVILKAI